MLEFANQKDLDHYLTAEPNHLQFSKKAVPLVADSVVIDIHDGILFGSPAPRPSLAAKGSYRGTCHCNAVTWTAKLDKEEHVLCHCSTCQRLGKGHIAAIRSVHEKGSALFKVQTMSACTDIKE